MKSDQFKLAIIEDNPIILKALEGYFKTASKFELLITAASTEDFVSIWKDQRIDIVLCDIGLPGKSGIEATWYIKRKSYVTQVVMFTVFEDKETIFQALCAGASGYLLKDTPLPKIEEQLIEVMDGGSVMSPQVARMVIGYFNPLLDKVEPNEIDRLTTREIEIISMLQHGASYKTVAKRLFISVDTVKFHIRNIYSKLQISSRTELINKY
ncbi:DNA-binding response regulator [Parapedobacter defluvii]|uniref:DNA-binding response regulator n=1 Tax=Parapedobacter defluvii TaxID=2045106 RepID=A0ABQ1L3D2_9SPHI|nr:response regulator transcription factor [Parapedobacter defluvii]GGC16369.1 DNA-binding response regulator [Parapedobacter defluvii]